MSESEANIPSDVVRGIAECFVPPSGIVDVVVAVDHPDAPTRSLEQSGAERGDQPFTIAELDELAQRGGIAALTLRYEQSYHRVLVRAIDDDVVVLRPFCDEADCWCLQMPDRPPIPAWPVEIHETARLLARGTDRRPGFMEPGASETLDSMPTYTEDPPD